MPLPFSEVSYWPQAIDSYMSLEDNATPNVDDSQVLWAQHYNKLRGSIYNMQKYWTGVSVASGDGTFNNMSLGLTCSVTIKELASIVVKGAYSRIQANHGVVFDNEGRRNIVGNTLPFEFVYTTSDDDYSKWKDANMGGTQLFIQYSQEASGLFLSFLGQALGGNYPLVSCSLEDLHTGVKVCPPILAQAWVMAGSDTLIVRGFLQDLAADPGGDYEIWDQYSHIKLHCTLIALSTNL